MKFLIDLTDHCNSKCPLCARHKTSYNDEVAVLKPDPSMNRSSISLADWKSWFPIETLRKTELIYFQGSFGEPSLNEDLLDIYSYTLNANSSIVFQMSTNGGTRDQEFWGRLGALMASSHRDSFLIFSIDGLSDTLQQYRVGVDYNKVIDSARAFIKAGGPAVWRMLVFKHNQHQIKRCRNLSRLMGFKDFRHTNVNDLYDASGKGDGTFTYEYRGVVHKLEGVDGHVFQQPPAAEDTEIDCRYGHGIKSPGQLRIDSRGIVHACCFHQSRLRFFYPDYYVHGDIDSPAIYRDINNPNKGVGAEYMQKVFYDSMIPLIENQGGLKSLSLKHNSLEDVLNTPLFQCTLVESWNKRPHICSDYCGVKRKNVSVDTKGVD